VKDIINLNKMKKFPCILMLVLLTLGGCSKYDDNSIRNEVGDLKNRVATLEQWATTVNSNISALQNLVSALQNMDYITGVTAFASPAPGGYVISFVKGGNVTIFNGTDGQNGTGGKEGTGGKDGTDGRDGIDGRDGESPQISLRQDTDGVYYWTLNGEWILAGGNKMRVTGERGSDGSNGQDGHNGLTPQLQINSGIWEISYDEGSTWTSLGVAAAGIDGQNGQNGLTPQLRVNSGIWEVSYDEGSTWTSLGVEATGQNGVSPKIRINTLTGEWEISCDNGASWETGGIKATGEKGDRGDAVFAANGVDYSNSNYVEFTLADGYTKIKISKYKKLGLDFTQPEPFAAGETKTVEYTPEGDVAVIKFLDMPLGWIASVDYSARTFTVTAPSTFNSDNRGGEAIILVSDKEQNTIMHTVNFIADGAEGYIAIEGYSGNAITVYYADGANSAITKSMDNSYAVPANNKIIERIVLEGGATIIAGRKADGSIIAFKLSGGDLVFRDAVDGYIPVGTYSEFQLINTEYHGYYMQEADLDLLDLGWMPIGTPYRFTGVFDGNNHTIANLKINGTLYTGLFGSNDGTVRNVHVISGSVSGGDRVGGICGDNSGSIFGCTNACTVSGNGRSVGGICGHFAPSYSSFYSPSYSSYIADCHNTGSVTGSNFVGGVCGEAYANDDNDYYSSVTVCYNTGSVAGSNCVGGVCGFSSSSITDCHNTGSVTGSYSVGGVCGEASADYYSSYFSITACHNAGLITGSGSVGGVCGHFSSSSSFSSSYYYAIIACYNTGSVTGSDNSVGGVCGHFSSSSSSSSSIITCYNTELVIGSDFVGGVCGSSSGTGIKSIIACYNAGSVSGNHYVGGIHGSFFSSSSAPPSYPSSSTLPSITACYWKDIAGDNADYGIAESASNTGASIFASGVWPVTGTPQQWGTGNGNGDGKYWKSLGGWNGGNPVYPKLYFED
jgi:hypothetical protein